MLYINMVIVVTSTLLQQLLPKFCERKMVEVLNGNYGEDDKVEVTSVNQMGKSTIKYASMSETALLNLINFTAGSKLISNHTPL